MVLKELKANNATKHIPVVIASNLGEEENRKKCMNLGATGYFIKTEISLSELERKLKTYLQ